MKIKNETYWRTDHIRALVLKVARNQFMEPWQIKNMLVHIVWRRGRRRLGEAFLGKSCANMSRHMRLFMDRDTVDPVQLAHTIGHEIGHMKGLDHRQMRGRPAFDYSIGWRDLYAWAAAFPVEARPVRERPSKPAPSILEIAVAHHAKAAAMVKTWTAKMKRAQTALKKWERRARLREKKVAALRQPARAEEQAEAKADK